MGLSALLWLEEVETSERGSFHMHLPVPDSPDDADAGVPFASKARQGSQMIFLMFDGSLQFLLTHFKITEGDHLLPP